MASQLVKVLKVRKPLRTLLLGLNLDLTTAFPNRAAFLPRICVRFILLMLPLTLRTHHPSSSCSRAGAPVPQVFKHATVFFSRDTPYLADVIPAMDHIDKVLTNASLSSKYVKLIRVACGLAKKALNKYYSYTDMSDTYRIAISESFSRWFQVTA